ncbi:MAG: hypothetical protein ACOYEG_03910 [Petrimonas sp.]|jgi:hypothetical protein
MKRKILFAFSLLFVLLIGYSCTSSPTQDYLDEYEVRRMIDEAIKQNNENLKLNFTQWKIINITAKKADWKWIEKVGRYEAIYDLPELTEFIYENGAAIGYVFLGTQNVDEVQKPLPFVHTYSETDEEGNTVFYTETISCDFALGTPSTVAFFIQASDLFRADQYLADYNFRVVLIW